MTSSPAVPAAPRAGGTYVGLMSGTSLDGITAAVARFAPAGDSAFNAELLGFHVHEYCGQDTLAMVKIYEHLTAKS